MFDEEDIQRFKVHSKLRKGGNTRAVIFKYKTENFEVKVVGEIKNVNEISFSCKGRNPFEKSGRYYFSKLTTPICNFNTGTEITFN